MAFTREYAEQGDPFPRRSSMRAGRLASRRLSIQGRPVTVAQLRRMFGHQQGDPFSFRLPKFIRKFQPGKALARGAKGLVSVAKAALPIAAPFIPGVGPFLAPLLGGSMAGGGGPDTAAPELTQQPEYRGPVSQVARGYEVPGIEVSAPRYRDFAPISTYDEDDYEDEDQGEDESDYEDDDLYYDEG